MPVATDEIHLVAFVIGPGLDSTSPDNKRVFPDSLYKATLNFLTFFEYTWHAIVYNLNQCYAELKTEMGNDFVSHFCIFLKIDFNERILSFAIDILDVSLSLGLRVINRESCGEFLYC